MELEIVDTALKNKKLKNRLSLVWSSHERDKNSVNFYLKIYKKKIRKKYIEIIDKIIDSNTIKYSRLVFEEISLVKMSQINEKNIFLSNGIYNCLKILALEEFTKNKNIKKIIYNGKNKDLQLTLRDWFGKNFISNKKYFFNFKIRNYFANGIIFYIKQFIKNFNLKKNKEKLYDRSIFSYFVHLSTKENEYKSNLWGNLPKFFNEKKINHNWFHYFVPSSDIRNSKIANKKIKNFNKNIFEKHNFINSYLSFFDYIKIFFSFHYYFFFNKIVLKDKKSFFLNNKTSLNFYYFLKNDFKESFFGAGLIISLSNIIIFKNLLSTIPKQKFGIYILENLSWEICLKYFWRKYGHGKLFAYFNSSLRFWDIRYYKSSKKKFLIKKENPDFYLFNGKVNKINATNYFYPKKKSVVVESLRYSHLAAKKLKVVNKDRKKVLIVGDIVLEENFLMLEQVSSIQNLFKNYIFYFKAHPTISFKNLNHLKIKFNNFKFINDESKKFVNYNFIICSNSTSAAIDCLIQNLNFAIFKGYDRLDLNPLPSYLNIFKIYEKKHLINFLSRIKYSNNKNISKFINLNLKLLDFKRFLYMQKYSK